ncbi:hypothetical protein ACOSQ4_003992 [Xanthoceras sorbifolium]
MADEEGSEAMSLSRKEKRKLAKKMKRKEKRKETAEKEKEEEEAEDPEEQRKLETMLREAEEERERALKEFEERERLWIQAMELKKKKEEEEEEEEEEERRKAFEEEQEAKRQLEVGKETACDEDDDWEYIEEGPAEIIWQGNEIIIKKKKVRIPKKDANQLTGKENTDRPTSNPLPPQSEAFCDYKSAQQALESVARQVPNFGTEQDKAHCPFHLKTGACRFGQSCSRVHFYPDKSCTLLIKNMYNGPGLAWEQDEGLEYTDEEVERSYEEFYEDVHTEFLKFGEIVNFKVCKNGSFHLRGNVYVHYKSLESAVLAYQSVNGRYFAGKQVKCEFVSLARWKVAICGEYMKSRFKTCSHGTACNFIHCFRNPGGDYEWADWDKPPPKYWVKKMVALFGYSDEYGYEKQVDQDTLGPRRNSSKFTADSDRHRSRRSRSREMDHVKGGSGRSRDDENDLWESTHSQSRNDDNRKRIKLLDEKLHKGSTKIKDYHHSENKSYETDSDEYWSDRDIDKDRDRQHVHRRKSTQHGSRSSEKSADYGNSKRRIHEADSNGNWLDEDRDTQINHARTKKSLRYSYARELEVDNGDNRSHEAHVDRQDMDEDGESEHSYLGKDYRHSYKGSRSVRVNSEADYRNSKTNRDHKSRSPDKCDERFNKHNRREIVSLEEHPNSRRKTSCVQSSEFSSPGRYNGRSKSRDLNSEYCSNDKIDDGRWESNEDAYEEHQKSRSKSTCDDKDQFSGKSYSYNEHSSELYNERRSRGSSRSSRERNPKCTEMEIDSSKECQEYEENYRSHRVERRSHGHRRRDK